MMNEKLKKYEDERYEQKCSDIEDALQVEIDGIKKLRTMESILAEAIRIEGKIDQLVKDEWMHSATGNGYKRTSIRLAMNHAEWKISNGEDSEPSREMVSMWIRLSKTKEAEAK